MACAIGDALRRARIGVGERRRALLRRHPTRFSKKIRVRFFAFKRLFVARRSRCRSFETRRRRSVAHRRRLFKPK
jgi:hypothetical protein